MGAVYEAHRTGDPSARVAIKLINDEAVAKDEVLLARFEREAFAAQKITSPYIVSILDAGHADGGHPYMVMELLEGENALQLLQRIGPLPPALAVRIGIHTCRGLAEAHEAGVVHRDIKPANLFLSDGPGGEVIVKLLDFGVAKFKMDQASDSHNQSLTRTGSMLGSPMYMSPEQARGLKSIDHRADIWSMGIVLYQLLSGRVPYQDIDGLGELIITICSEPPPRVTEVAEWVPPAIADVIAGALALSTKDRYQSAAEMAEALASCLEDAGDDGESDHSKIDKSMIHPLALETTLRMAGEAATLAIDGDVSDTSGTLALSPEELAEAAASDRADAPPESYSTTIKQRDQRALAKHRNAQRSAIEAARLDASAASSPNWLLIAIIGCVIIGTGAYLYARFAGTPEPAPLPAPSSPADGQEHGG